MDRSKLCKEFIAEWSNFPLFTILKEIKEVKQISREMIQMILLRRDIDVWTDKLFTCLHSTLEREKLN